MPTARAALAAGVARGRLYAAGGANASGALATLEIYDFARRRWRRGPDMSLAREHLAGAALGGAFYALAGRTVVAGNFAVAERFVPRRKPLGAAARHGQGPRRRGRGRAGRPARRRRRGGARGTIAPVERYDPARRRWSLLAPMRTPRHGLGVVASGHRVFALEGGPMPGFAFSRAAESLTITG